ncbi:family 8 carbohydrate esterase [Camillea tinctor]|nr:family 8 carbohydrate esterase [Camillea tinctor]
MNSLLVGFTAFAATALAAGRTSAPAGCLNVAKSGGDYSTIQSAVNSLSTSSSEDQCIFINPGTYSEQVLVSARTAQLTLYGYTDDTSSYSGNQVTITSSLSQANGLSNDETATLRVKAVDFKMYNINVENGYGEGSQAVALSAYADSGYYGCAFYGFQDTLLSNVGHQVYAKSLISGATDFIFGQQAAAWFEQCDIRVLGKSLGYITANGRESSSDVSFYVFNNCDVAAGSGESVPDGAYYLGRPWREYARVVFQNTAMSAVINKAGWSIWNSGDERTSGVLFGEYDNSGTGAAGPRASFATTLSAPETISGILTSSYSSAGYYDDSYM